MGGGSYTVWSKDGIVSGADKFTVHATTHLKAGAKSIPVVVMPDMPDGQPRTEIMQLVDHNTGEVLQKQHYKIEYDGNVVAGETTEKGLTTLIQTAVDTPLKVLVEHPDIIEDTYHVAYYKDSD